VEDKRRAVDALPGRQILPFCAWFTADIQQHAAWGPGLSGLLRHTGRLACCCFGLFF
jgi:hypothetical protein